MQLAFGQKNKMPFFPIVQKPLFNESFLILFHVSVSWCVDRTHSDRHNVVFSLISVTALLHSLFFLLRQIVTGFENSQKNCHDEKRKFI